MCIILGIGLNIIGCAICDWLALPLRGDVVGTMFAAILLGPLAGMIVSILSGLYFLMLFDIPFVYTCIGIIVGMIIGLLFPRKNSTDSFTIVSIANIAAIVSALMSIPLNLTLRDGKPDNFFGNALYDMLGIYVNNDYSVTFMSELFVDVPDRVISIGVALFLIKVLKVISKKHAAKKGVATVTALFIAFGLLLTPMGQVLAEDDDINTDYEIVKYNADDGIKSTQVNVVKQTEDGYIWAGTYSGLYRFDGVKFENAALDPDIRNVMSIFEDSKGRLWIGTNDRGAFCIDMNSQEIQRYDKTNGLEAESVRAICEDGYGNIYLGTMLSLSMVKPSGEVKTFSEEELVYTRFFSKLKDGSMAGVTNTGVLYVVKGDKVLFTAKAPDADTVFREVECSDDEILVGSSKQKVYVYGQDGDKLELKDTFMLTGISYVNDFLYDAQFNGYYVCCENGIGYIDKTTKKQLAIEQSEIKGELNSVCVDQQGNIWFASSKEGLIKYSKTIFVNVTRKAGIDAGVTNAVLVDGDELYIATDKGLRVINKNDYKEIHKDYAELMEGMRIRHILKDSAGNIWFSTYGENELVKVQPDGSVKVFDEKKDGLMGEKMRFTFELSDGRILASGSKGLTFIKDDKVVATMGQENGLDNPYILTVYENEDGSILAGSDGDGIYIIKDDKVIGHIGEEEGLDTDVVLRIVKNSDGFFFVTSNAIYLEMNSRVYLLDKFEYSNNYDIITTRGTCYIPSSAGLFIVDEDNLIGDMWYDATLLDSDWGLRTTFNANSWNALDGDELYLCCIDGVRRISTKRYGIEDTNYHAHLKYIETAEGYIKEKNGEFRIPASQGRVVFHIAVNNYMLSNPNVHYYLEGREDEGLFLSQKDITPLNYSTLPGGKYTMVIEVRDPQSNTLLVREEFKIVKEKMVYERTLFRIYLVLVVSFMAFYVAWLVYSINKRSKRILGLQKEMTTDPMTGILNKAGSHRALEAACKTEVGMLLMIDLDSFKLVNDLYGHDMGDKILIRFAELMKEGTCEGDICGRLGGDEFVAFMKNVVDEQEIDKFTKFMNREIVKSAKEYMGPDMNIPLGTSIGAVHVPVNGTDFEELFKLADKALYMVKQNGKHGYSIYRKKNSLKELEEKQKDRNSLPEIKKIIGERNEGKGAYEVNFDKFQTVYKFLNRNDKVTENSTIFGRICFKIEDDRTVTDEERESFEDILIRSLKKNDIVTVYSGDFYILFTDGDKDSFSKLAKTVEEKWKEALKENGTDIGKLPSVEYETEMVG